MEPRQLQSMYERAYYYTIYSVYCSSSYCSVLRGPEESLLLGCLQEVGWGEGQLMTEPVRSNTHSSKQYNKIRRSKLELWAIKVSYHKTDSFREKSPLENLWKSYKMHPLLLPMIVHAFSSKLKCLGTKAIVRGWLFIQSSNPWSIDRYFKGLQIATFNCKSLNYV